MIGKNRSYVGSICIEREFGAFDQPWAEDGMRNIGARLFRRSDPVFSRQRALAKPAQLRKNVPHPMALLGALP